MPPDTITTKTTIVTPANGVRELARFLRAADVRRRQAALPLKAAQHRGARRRARKKPRAKTK
jgi:hypothetical protein